MTKDSKQAATEAAHAHTNLNTWGSVIALLEGGLFYGERNHQAERRVINIAKAEQQKHLRRLDAAMKRIAS